MVPKNNLMKRDLEGKKKFSKTYYVDFKRKRIVGYTDGIEAVRQAVYKILNTERYEYLIYSFNYGVELEELIGKDREYVVADIERRIEEALTQDDRIKGISGLNVERGSEKNEILVNFNVDTKYGELNITREVKI